MVERGGAAAAAGEEDQGLWPKHHRVYLILKQEISDGVYSDSEPLQGELGLAERFNVSRITVRKAMARLTEEGIVKRQRGRGTFPRAKGVRPSPVMASLSGNIENLIALGLETDVVLIASAFVAAPPDVCALMGSPNGTTMQRAVRVRSLKGVPFSHLTTWLPEEIGRSFSEDEMRQQPLLALIERAGHRVTRAQQSISAKLAAPEVADLLQIEPGAPLLAVRRRVFDAEGQVVELINGLYRPDTYEHHMEFDRSGGNSAQVWTARAAEDDLSA